MQRQVSHEAVIASCGIRELLLPISTLFYMLPADAPTGKGGIGAIPSAAEVNGGSSVAGQGLCAGGAGDKSPLHAAPSSGLQLSLQVPPG